MCCQGRNACLAEMPCGKNKKAGSYPLIYALIACRFSCNSEKPCFAILYRQAVHVKAVKVLAACFFKPVIPEQLRFYGSSGSVACGSYYGDFFLVWNAHLATAVPGKLY